MKHTLKLALIALGMVILSMSRSWGQTPNIEGLSLEELLNVKVSTASKKLEQAGKAPASVFVINAEQIRTRRYYHLAELLNDLPDVKLNDKSDPQYFHSLNIRGINGQDHFVILLDGIKISSPTNDFQPLLENYPLYLAKQVEIVYGPGSALYGADAMAGVINIITDQGTDSETIQTSLVTSPDGYFNQYLFARKALSNGFILSAGGQISYDKQPNLSKIYAGDFPMDGHKTGTFNSTYGSMKPAHEVDPDYSAPVRTNNLYLGLEKGGFDLKVLHYYSQVPSSTTLRPNNAVYNKDVFFGHNFSSASVSYTDSIGAIRSLSSLQSSYYEINPKSSFRNIYGGMEHGYKFGYGSMMKLEEQLSMTIIKNLHFTAGLTYESFRSLPKTVELESPVIHGKAVEGILLNSTAAYRPEGIAAKVYPLTFRNIGSFLQTQYTPCNNLSLTMGVRYDHSSRYGHSINPRVGLIYNHSEKTVLKALYGTAYWAPSPQISYEQFGSFYTEDSGQTFKSDFWHLPNPELKPTTSQTTELNIIRQITKNLNLTLSGYYTKVRNVITNVPDNGNTNFYHNQYLGYPVSYIEVPFNNGLQKIYGGNVSINTLFTFGVTKFNAWLSASVVEGTSTGVDGFSKNKEVELPFVAPWLFRAGIDGYSGKFSWSLRLLQSGKQRVTGFLNTVDPFERQFVKGYALLNASANYHMKDRLTFFLKGQNITDQRYRNVMDVDMDDQNSITLHGSPQDPIRIMAGLSYTLN